MPSNAPHPSETPTAAPLTRQKALRLYALGQGAIVVGAYFMQESGSMAPMALGASAGIMLTMPLLRQMGARWARPRG